MSIVQPCFLCRLGKFIVAIEIGVRIGFKDDDLAFRRHAKIDASVAANAQSSVHRFADLHDALVNAVGERLGEDVLNSPTLAISVIPFGFERREFWLALGNLRKDDFTKGKYPQAVVAEKAHVNFSAVDIFLDERSLIHLLMNEVNALLEGLVRLDKRIEGNSIGGFFFSRLDKKWKFQPGGTLDCRSGREHGEV